jgi:PAS domain S-box-containing protein
MNDKIPDPDVTGGRDPAQDRTAVLEESVQYYRSLFQSCPIGLALCGMDGMFVDVNHAFANILGRTVEETVGLSYWEITPERYADQERMQLESLKSAGHYGPYEKEYFHKDGRLVPVRLQGRVIERDNVPLIWSSVEDITARKLVEAEMQREHNFSEALIDSLPGIMYLFDQDMKQLRLNKNLERVSGYSAEEIEQMGPFALVAEDQREYVQMKAQEVFANGASTVEADFISRDGRRTPYFFTGVRTEIDGMTCLVGIGIDMSERKRLEKELTDLNANLERRVAEEVEKNLQKDRIIFHHARLAAMGELLNNIAHQWRQPLNHLALLIQSALLECNAGTLTTESFSDLAKRCLDTIRYMSGTINTFQSFFLPVGEHQQFDPYEIVERSVALVRASYEESGIKIDTANHGIGRIRGVTTDFSQVLINMLNNAREVLTLRHTPEPAVVIECSSQDGTNIITISDNAGGIPEEIIDRIFDPYFTTKFKSPGIGIALYIAKMTIEKSMGGRLSAYNTAQGAKFVIELPSGKPSDR